MYLSAPRNQRLCKSIANRNVYPQLINDHGMDVFSKYLTKLVFNCASQIFPAQNRTVGGAGNGGNYTLLRGEMEKIARDVKQATRISESIETGTEDLFREFDLSTFMEHFRLDPLEKTILALAFKLGNRPDLKTKGTLARSRCPTLAAHAAMYSKRPSLHGSLLD